MQYKPHEYQARGTATLLSNQGAGLCLDPGLGKTSTALHAFVMMKAMAPELKMLVIAPINTIYDTWPREIEKWDQFKHLTYSILHGRNKDGEWSDDADIYLLNPEGLQWFVEQPHRNIHILCVDESTRFKNSRSKRSKTLKLMLPSFERRWIMTGTIVPNGLKDIFNQVYIMDQGQRLGRSVTRFYEAYFYRTGYQGYTLKPREGAMEAVSGRIEDIVLSLSAEDYLEMPDLMKIERVVTLPDGARELYKGLEDDFCVEINESEIFAANAAVLGTKLRQVANGFLYDEEGNSFECHAAKIEELRSLTEELTGSPLLIFYEYQADLRRIQKLLPTALCLTGLKGEKLQLAIKQFNQGEIDYLIMHPGSSHGLNIQDICYHMIWFGLPWNLEYYLQAVWRLYRQGQRSATVYCYHILARDTLDERVSKVLLAKESTQAALLEALKRNDHELPNCV